MRTGHGRDESGSPAIGRGLVSGSGAVVAVLVLLFGVGAAVQTDRADTSSAEAELARDAAGVFEAFTSAEVAVLEQVPALATRMAATGPSALSALRRDAERLPDVGFVAADPGGSRVVAGSLPGLPDDVDGVPALVEALTSSRDASVADVALSPPVEGSPPSVYAATPVFRAGGGLSTTPPIDTAARRASIAGWVVARVDPAPPLDAALPAGLVGRVRDGETVLVGPGAAADDVVRRAVTVGHRRWTIDVWRQGGLDVGVRGWWWLVAGVVGAAVVLDADARSRRRRRRAEALAESALSHVGLVADLAPVVQRSLELGEVLPAVATATAGELGLAGLVFAEADADNEYRDVFAIGAVEALAPGQPVPTSLLPGECLSIPLQRGSRAVGMLRIKAGRAMSVDDLRCVRIAAELATAAIVTGRLFSQQEEAVDRLRELDVLKSVFLATASHELRTPLVAITGFSGLLNDQWDQLSDADRREFAARIATNAHSLGTLIEALLDFSRLEQGALEVRLDAVDLSATVTAVLDQLAPTVGTHTLEVDLAPGAVVAADPFGIERIVTNLVANAVKYSPTGSTVAVRVTRVAGRTCLVVDDDGPGIPEEQRERIFSRFYRGEGDMVVRTKGVGIGLSVVKEFADQMGVDIEVSNRPTGGARFVLWFPAPEDAGSADVDEEESRAPLP